MPASRHRSRSPFKAWAVMAMIGRCPPACLSLPRIAAVASNPFISGICTSINTKSNGWCSKALSTSRPLAAKVTRCPCFSNKRLASFWLTTLSSANRTWRNLRSSRRECCVIKGVRGTEWGGEASTFTTASSRSDGLMGLVR